MPAATETKVDVDGEQEELPWDRPVELTGEFRQAKSEDYELFLRKCGVEYVARRKERLAKQKEIVEIDGDRYDKTGENGVWRIRQLDTTNDCVNFDIKFKLKQPVTYQLPYGPTVVSEFRLRDDNKLKERLKYQVLHPETQQLVDADMMVDIVREFHDGGIHTTYQCWHHSEKVRAKKIWLRENYTPKESWATR